MVRLLIFIISVLGMINVYAFPTGCGGVKLGGCKADTGGYTCQFLGNRCHCDCIGGASAVLKKAGNTEAPVDKNTKILNFDLKGEIIP